MTAGAIIVAAGRSERMGGGIDKLLAPLGERPLIAHTMDAFAGHPSLDELVIVASEANRDAIRSIARETAPDANVVLGGERRRDSVLAGLDALGECEYVVVHDAARPFVTKELIDAALEGAQEYGAAICGVAVSDTVKRVDAAGLVQSTVSRTGLWLAQTPQAFHSGLLLMAHQSSEVDVTDDAALVELMGGPVRVVQGSSRNIKVTMPEDLVLAEALLTTKAPH
jgi:2-C-methyl-D-erythritol 4-phosphate cytidylyltransferase